MQCAAVLFVEIENAAQTTNLATGTHYLDAGESRRRASCLHAEPTTIATRLTAMDPRHKREILNMPLGAGSDEPQWYQPRLVFPLHAATRRPRPRFAPLAIAEERKFLHPSAIVAIVPSGKTNKRNVLVRVLHACAGVPMIGRQTKMRNSKPGLKALFPNKPVGGTLLLCVCGLPDLRGRRTDR